MTITFFETEDSKKILEMLLNTSSKVKELTNHEAYMDVIDCNDPTYPNDDLYMYYYRQWKAVAGTTDEHY